MILKKTIAIKYLKTVLSEQKPIQLDKNTYFFPDSRIGFFPNLLPDKQLISSIPNAIWVTSNYFSFRNNLAHIQPLYLLTKEKNAYQVYDRRYVKLKKGKRLLPPVLVDFAFFKKNFSLKEKEEELFFPSRNCSFFCKGDTTYRLQNIFYLQRIEKIHKELCPTEFFNKIFLFFKEKLDR